MRQATLGMKNAAVALLMANALAVLLFGLSASSGVVPVDLPPIITLSEAEGFTFQVGSAAISPRFGAALARDIGPRIAELANLCGCDVIEIIGHTDGQRVRGGSSLDGELAAAVAGARGLTVLTPGSNADLGLMRAWAVARALAGQEWLHGFRFAAYSAGHMLMTDGSHARAGDFADSPARRRIEIRIRRSDGTHSATASSTAQ